MKALKKIKKKLATFMSLVFLFGLYASCSNTNDVNNTIEDVVAYSGEEIFRAMFFLEGDLVDKIPSLRHSKIERDAIMENPTMVSMIENSKAYSGKSFEAEVADFRNSAAQMIGEINPEIFDNLKRSLTQGNISLLDETVKEVAALLNTVMIQNERVANDVKVVDYAYKHGGISPKDYNMSTVEGIKEYNMKVGEFMKSEGLAGKFAGDEMSGIIIVFLVVAFVLVAVGAYLLVLAGGGVLFFIAGGIYIEIEVDWGVDPVKGTKDDLGYNLMLAEFMNYANATN